MCCSSVAVPKAAACLTAAKRKRQLDRASVRRAPVLYVLRTYTTPCLFMSVQVDLTTCVSRTYLQ